MDQVFRISGSDYFSLLDPRLAATMVPEAPGVTVQMLDHPGGEAVRLLGEGTIDMGVEADFDLPDWAASHRLFRSFIATVARRDHPVLAAAGNRLASGFRRKSTARCRMSSCRWMGAGQEPWTGCWPSAGWRVASR